MDKVANKHSQLVFIQVMRGLREGNLLPPQMVLSEMQDLDIEDLVFHNNGWSNPCALDLLTMEFLAASLQTNEAGRG